jgi:CRISPR/Cas system CSM-associated protein Csm3 (group 7 of RAMP superfamily)
MTAPTPAAAAPASARRCYVRVALVVEGQWRVGTWRHDGGGDGAEDRVLVAVSRLAGPAAYLPGSGLRGSLRAHLHAVLGPARTGQVFGPEPPEDRPGGQQLSASPWWVLDAVLPEGSWQVRTRGQSGIDRQRRAPYRRTLRTAETIAPVGDGPHVLVYLRCDPGGDPACAREVLDALASWQPRIGAGRSTGLGRTRVVSVAHRDIDLGGRGDLLARLAAGGGPAGLDALLAGSGAVTRPVDQEHPDDVVVSVEFQLPDGWLPTLDPAAETREEIDGSTWKGLVRSRVEFIARSVGRRVCGETVSGNSPWQCGQCAVCAVFGSPVAGGVVEFSTTPVRGGSEPSVRLRNAIDRFTGGARDGALFAESVQTGARMRLEIRCPEQVEPWVARAVLHAVRDLADGLVGIGPRSGTGLGTLAAEAVTVGPAWRPHLGLPAAAQPPPAEPLVLKVDEIGAIAVTEATP